MQVIFSTFIIAVSFLNYLFGVATASPIPGAGGTSPRGSLTHSPSSRASLTRSKSSSASLNSQTPVHKPYVHDKPYPMAKEPVLTNKEWHKERVDILNDHLKDMKKERHSFYRNTKNAVGEGNLGQAAKEVGSICLMGMVCGGVKIAKAIHTHKANKPGP